MRILTRDEAEELIEHFISRPDIWFEHKSTWIRVDETTVIDCPTGCEGKVRMDQIFACEVCRGVGKVRSRSFALALKVRNGLPDDFYGLTQKALRWEQRETDIYVDWLVQKYTAFSLRAKVQNVLSTYSVQSTRIEALSRDLCKLHGFTRKYDKRETSIRPNEVSRTAQQDVNGARRVVKSASGSSVDDVDDARELD